MFIGASKNIGGVRVGVGTHTKKHKHGVIWWVCIGWWIWILKAAGICLAGIIALAGGAIAAMAKGIQFIADKRS